MQLKENIGNLIKIQANILQFTNQWFKNYRVMEALSKNGVPIPEMLGLCEDCDIIGTPFYLMKYVPGKIYKDPSLPGVDPESRQKIYSAMNRTIAKIHSVDVNKAGLSDYGKVIIIQFL